MNERIRVLAASCFASEVFHMLRSAACCLVKAFAEQEWAMYVSGRHAIIFRDWIEIPLLKWEI